MMWKGVSNFAESKVKRIGEREVAEEEFSGCPTGSQKGVIWGVGGGVESIL